MFSSLWEQMLLRAAKEKTKTSVTPINKVGFAAGFTLVEILVVMAIIAAASLLALNRVNFRQNEMKSLARELGSLSRELHAFARLSQKTYRLVLNLNDEETHQYWVESSSVPGANVEKMEEASRGGDKPKPSAFQMDKSILKGPVAVPRPLRFEDVELASRDKIFKSGLVYIHYLPAGLTEEAAIHVTDDDKIHWSLLLDPLTGDLIPQGEHVSLKGSKK